MTHRIISENKYTEWFAQGHANETDVRHLIVQFSVFSNFFIIAQLRKVIVLKPDHHHAYNALGYSFADRNVRLPEAKQLIETALKLAPNEPFIVDSLGWVEFRLGNLPTAAKLLRQAYAARPDTEIAAHLGEVLWLSSAQDEARKVFAEAAQREPDNEALREAMSRLKVKP